MDFTSIQGTIILLVLLMMNLMEARLDYCVEPCICAGMKISCKDSEMDVVPEFRTINGANIVDLSKNNLLIIEKSSFKWSGTIQLQYLYLNANSIVMLEMGAFDHIANLERIDLSNNELATIPEDIILRNRRLRVLNLAGNMLHQTVPIIYSDSLRELDLSFNKLDTVTEDSFAGLVNLQKLHLQSNNFQFIDPDVFLQLPGIQYVDFNMNVWACNCSSQRLFAFAKDRGLFTATVPISCGVENAQEIVLLENSRSNNCYESYDSEDLEDDRMVIINDDENVAEDSGEFIIDLSQPEFNITTRNSSVTFFSAYYDLRYGIVTWINFLIFLLFVALFCKLLVLCIEVCRPVNVNNVSNRPLLVKHHTIVM